MNVNMNTLRFKPLLAWNERTTAIYQKIEHGIELLQCKCNNSLPDLTSPNLSNSQNFLVDELEKMLRQINNINAEIKQLQILKVWLCVENTTTIGNLLQNNAYLKYNEEQLEKLIRITDWYSVSSFIFPTTGNQFQNENNKIFNQTFWPCGQYYFFENMSNTKFIATVSSIISSRLQYIKFMQQKLFETDQLSENTASQFQITDDASAAYAHDLIVEFENFSRANRLLTLMWNHLRISNAKIIFELLSNNKYLSYSVEDLSAILKTTSIQSQSTLINSQQEVKEVRS